MIAEQLRKSILQAAIQGKLTKQLPEDGDARDLLKEIQKEKQRLIREGKIKKEKPLPEIAEEEIPFEIPANWCWVRLQSVCSTISDGDHQPPPQAVSGIPFIVISNLSRGVLSFDNTRFVSKDYFNKLHFSKVAKRGDILFSVTGSYGIPVMVNCDTPFCFQRHIALLKTLVDYRLLYFWLGNPHLKNQCDDKATGTAQKTIGLFTLKNLIIPLPPLSEQHRIVERLEEVLPFIDKLAGDETKLDELLKSFPKKMRDAILQAAIQGKLTEQLPEDGDARDLLKEIQKEKQRLTREGKIKKDKPSPEISEEEIPFDIPTNWCWARLGELIERNIGGGTPSRTNSEFWGGSIPWASVKDLNCKELRSTEESITELGLRSSSSNLIPKGNLIVCTRMGLGKIVINTIDVAINQDLRALFIPMNIDIFYLYHFYSTLSFFGKGATVKGISIEELEAKAVPLPPLAEQHRIVERLEKLLPLCDM